MTISNKPKPKSEVEKVKPEEFGYLLPKRFANTLKHSKFNESDFNDVVELLRIYKIAIEDKQSPTKFIKAFQNKYKPHFKDIKPYAERMLKAVKNDWTTSKMTLANADKTMRRLWHISELSPYVGKAFRKLCLKMVNILDEWVRKKVAKDPKLANLFIRSKISKLRKPQPKGNKLEDSQDVLTTLESLTGLKTKNVKQKNPTYSFTPKNLQYKVYVQNKDIKVKYGKELWTIKRTELISIKNGMPVGAFAIISDANPNIFIVIPFNKLKSIIQKGDFGKLTKKAKNRYEKEQKQKLVLEKYDLPKNKRISHLRFMPPKYDPVISTTLEASAVQSAILKQRYPKMKMNPIVFNENLLKEFENNIKRDYKAGIRVFNIEIYSHGLPNGLNSFKDKPTAKDLAKIIKKFPDAKFKINTVACFGGGLRQGFQREFKLDPTLKQRVDVFLQTKPDFVNIAAHHKVKWMYETKTKVYSTYYQLFLIKALQAGKTYGQALIEADRESQKLMYLNPEALIGGEHFVKRSKLSKSLAKA